MTKFGGPEVFEIQELPVPEPEADEVRVRISATGVAYADIKMRHGLYKTAPKPPMTPGYDFSGVVDAVGSEVRGFEVGDHCFGLSFYGASAEYLTIKTDYIAKTPAQIDPVIAAAIPLNYLTALQMLDRVADVPVGGTILVHGAGGGVGTAILDIAKDRELAVYGTASEAKLDTVRSYGAIPIDYRRESFVEILKGAGGADAVFDHIAGKHIRASAEAARPGGDIVIYGFMSAVQGECFFLPRSLWELFKIKFGTRKKAHFYAILTRGFSQMKHIPDDLAFLAKEVASGKLMPNVSKVMRLDEISEAHRLLEAGALVGKLVLTIDEQLVKPSTPL